MPVNHYFQDGKGIGNKSEKRLYEDLIIEGLKIKYWGKVLEALLMDKLPSK